MDTSGSGQAVFHVVAGGQCWLHGMDAPSPTPLFPGDLLILPRDTPHELSDSEIPAGQPPTDVRPLGDESAEGTDLLCGYFQFDDQVANPLLDALPDFLIIRQDAPGNEGMRRLIDLLVKEAADSEPGVEAVLERLSDALFIQAIRAYLRASESKGLAAALADSAVHRALQLMHGHPERGWKLASLARAAALSRSTLVQRFTGAMGEPPMVYLAKWRMKLAVRWLREGHTVAEVAERCGYGSEAGFAKAFKRHAGLGPGAARRPAGGTIEKSAGTRPVKKTRV